MYKVSIGRRPDLNKEDLKDWCWLNVGKIGFDWYYNLEVVRHYDKADTEAYVFSFMVADNATAFRLRWGT